MINHIRNAMNLLDEQGKDEIFRFLVSQQNADGGFQDRGGRSDLYYSLFGMMLLRAMEFEVRNSDGKYLELETWNLKLKKRLKHYISVQSSSKVTGFIEQCCLALLQKELKINRFLRIRTLMKLSLSFWKERNSINLSYRSFVLFLTLDAILPFRSILKRLSGKMLSRMDVDEHSPCSEVAAKVYLKKMMNKDEKSDQELLKSFTCESGGFRAFQHLQHSDMLSTAVALFALDFSGSDLRLLKPASLDFIQQNFVDGAFLSGDGDQTRDLEYTFYGLLALGVLAN
jgi:prenyltransferase beta subunit